MILTRYHCVVSHSYYLVALQMDSTPVSVPVPKVYPVHPARCIRSAATQGFLFTAIREATAGGGAASDIGQVQREGG
jgi:hypothetical protein